MGTRNLTIIFADDEYKVAQYGQYDGYPYGQGATALQFLHQVKPNILKKRCNNVKILTEDIRKARWLEFNVDITNKPYVEFKVAQKFEKKYPELSRGTGAVILDIIYKSKQDLHLENSIDFIADSLFCEWAYLVDLDHQTFEVYKGFNKEPLDESDRFFSFYDSNEDSEYYPCKLQHIFDLNNLPSEFDFFKILQEDDEEDEEDEDY